MNLSYFEIPKALGFETSEEFFDATENPIENNVDQRLLALASLAYFIVMHKPVSIPLIFFSSIVTGNKYKELGDFIKYIDKISKSKEKLIRFSVFLQKDINIENSFNSNEFHKFLGYKTQEEVEEKLSENLIELGKLFFENQALVIVLKRFSEYTTDISYSNVSDFLKYIELAFKEEELKNFILLIEKVKKSYKEIK